MIRSPPGGAEQSLAVHTRVWAERHRACRLPYGVCSEQNNQFILLLVCTADQPKVTEPRFTGEVPQRSAAASPPGALRPQGSTAWARRHAAARLAGSS